MKVTDVHANLHLTLTALQFAFSLPSVYTVCQSVISVTFCGINTIMAAVTLRSRSAINATKCKRPHDTPPTQRYKLDDTLETVAFGATSGVCVPHRTGNYPVTVLTVNRWQSNALAACIPCPTNHVTSGHNLELRHRIRDDELAS